jgi:hypothetical protein
MKLSSGFSFLKVIILALVAVAVIPSAAHAQAYTHGKFTLTTETHWGTAVLSAGSYEFMIESANPPSRVIVRRADRGYVAIVVPTWISAANSTDTSLRLESRGQEQFVSALCLNDANTELHFMVPKANEEALAPTTAEVKTSTASGSAQ